MCAKRFARPHAVDSGFHVVHLHHHMSSSPCTVSPVNKVCLLGIQQLVLVVLEAGMGLEVL